MGGAFEYASAERGREIERGREGWGCTLKRTWTFCLSTSFLPLSFPLSLPLPPSALHSSHKGRRGRRKGERRQSMKTFFFYATTCCSARLNTSCSCSVPTSPPVYLHFCPSSISAAAAAAPSVAPATCGSAPAPSTPQRKGEGGRK